jgi:hypothetical protein
LVSSNECTSASRIRALVARREDDRITLEEKKELAAHVAGCSSCSALATHLDPSLFFLPLSASLDDSLNDPLHDIAADDFEARSLAASTLAAIGRSERVRLRAPLRRPMLKAASVALLAGALLTFLVVMDRNTPLKTASSVPSPLLPALPEPVRAESASARPLIEEVRNPGARVYQFAASSPKDPSVVFVANPNADL